MSRKNPESEQKIVIETTPWKGIHWFRFLLVVGSLAAIFSSTLLSIHFNDPKIFETTISGVVSVGFFSFLFGAWG